MTRFLNLSKQIRTMLKHYIYTDLKTDKQIILEDQYPFLKATLSEKVTQSSSCNLG